MVWHALSKKGLPFVISAVISYWVIVRYYRPKTYQRLLQKHLVGSSNLALLIEDNTNVKCFAGWRQYSLWRAALNFCIATLLWLCEPCQILLNSGFPDGNINIQSSRWHEKIKPGFKIWGKYGLTPIRLPFYFHFIPGLNRKNCSPADILDYKLHYSICLAMLAWLLRLNKTFRQPNRPTPYLTPFLLFFLPSH